MKDLKFLYLNLYYFDEIQERITQSLTQIIEGYNDESITQMIM